MECEYVLQCLEENNVTIMKKKFYDFLSYDQNGIYILKEGIVKVSMILSDKREFNITYIKGMDLISLFINELDKCISQPLRIRIESESASFYCMTKEWFDDLAKQDLKIQDYINAYYRKKLDFALYYQQFLTMNGKNGAVYTFIYQLIPLFGKKVQDGVLIDLLITNDDIASFCGISTRNSVNRILRGLREENVIQIIDNKILIKNVEYLKQYA